jgi:hypothetical protein
MRKLGLVFALALSPALAGCPPGDVWTSRVEEPDEIADNPHLRDQDLIFSLLFPLDRPEHLFRKPADFRLLDPHLKKEFLLFLYEDESVSQEVVVVINKALPEKDQAPRLATREEHDYAIALLIGDWRARGEERKIRYFNERHEQEMSRNSTTLDYQIVYKRQEIEELRSSIVDLTADLKSRSDTGTFAGGNEQFDLAPTPSVEASLARTKRRLAIAEAQLAMLVYKRDFRDSHYARVGSTYVETSIECGDVAKHYSDPGRFVADVKMRAEPAAWSRGDARISYSDGTLYVRQTRDVAIKAREAVDQLRAEWKAAAEAAAKQPKPEQAPK